MSEEIMEQEQLQEEVQEEPIAEGTVTEEVILTAENGIETPAEPQKKWTKKKLIICGAALLAVIVLAIALLSKSKFEKVKDEVVQIAGRVTGSGNYFTIDTYPDEYENMDAAVRAVLISTVQKNALEAIKYANKELGFSSAEIGIYRTVYPRVSF